MTNKTLIIRPEDGRVPGEPILNTKVEVRQVRADGSLPAVKGDGVVLTIENDARKMATATAEEITEAVFNIFSIAPLPHDEARRAQALLKIKELKDRIYHTVQPICNRRMAALEKAVEKRH